MNLVKFHPEMQRQVDAFFEKCFLAVGILYSPKDRHADTVDVERHYMQNGCFWCLFEHDILIGTIAVRIIDSEQKVLELKRMFVLPEFQGNGYGRLLLEHAIAYAKTQQYYKVLLDTRRQFSAAEHLYRSSGFQEMEQYNDNRHAELFFELVL